jgi:hypothetical protein
MGGAILLKWLLCFYSCFKDYIIPLAFIKRSKYQQNIVDIFFE